MPTLEYIKQNADQLILVAEADVNNTLRQDQGFEDWLSGEVSVSGHHYDIDYPTNNKLVASSAPVHLSETSQIITSSFSVQNSLGEPYGSSSIEISVANLRFANVTSSDYIRLREFEDALITIKVGGLIDKGKPTEVNLTLSEYQPWIIGRVTSFTYDNSDVDIGITIESDKLNAHFPLNTYESGDSEGQIKAWGVGSYNGFHCASVGGGRYIFADEQFETNDIVYTRDAYPPFAYFGYGQSFFQEDYLIYTSGYTPSYDPDKSTYGLVAKSGYAYTQTDSKTVAGGGSFPVTISTDATDVELVANDDNSFSIERIGDQGTDTHYQGHFNWSVSSTTKAEQFAEPKVVLQLSGGVTFDPWRAASNGYVRIRTGTSGVVTLTFTDKVSDAVLVIRDVVNPGQTITGWSTTPDSISPAFDGKSHNHRISFKNLASHTISFTYTCSNIGEIVAVWFESVTTYPAHEARVSFVFDDKMASLDLVVEETSGISVNKIDATNTSSGTGQVTYGIDSELTNFNVDMNVDFGSTKMWIDQGRVSATTYGAFLIDDKILLKPNPREDYTDASSGVVQNRGGITAAALLTGALPSATDLKVEYKTRMDSATMTSANLKISTYGTITSSSSLFSAGSVLFGSGYGSVSSQHKTINRGLDWVTSEVSFTSYNSPSQPAYFAIEAIRDNVNDPYGQNPDTDFEVEVEFIKMEEREPIQGACVAVVVVDNIDVKLPTYRVSDTGHFSNLPLGIALYDDLGRLVVSDLYSGVKVNIKRDPINAIAAFRKLSVMAAGEDLITCDFDGERVSFSIDTQKPWIEHVSDMCLGLDYFIEENKVGDGITIKKRWGYDSYPTDFLWSTEIGGQEHGEEIILGSVSRLGNAQRQARYIVNYQKDYSGNDKTKTVKSKFGHAGFPERTIDTVLHNKADAENIALRIARDSVPNGIYKLSMVGIGLGHKINDVGFAYNDELPFRRACLIKDVLEDPELGQTDYIIKVFKGPTIYG